jgi:hypothetical protein
MEIAKAVHQNILQLKIPSYQNSLDRSDSHNILSAFLNPDSEISFIANQHSRYTRILEYCGWLNDFIITGGI